MMIIAPLLTVLLAAPAAAFAPPSALTSSATHKATRSSTPLQAASAKSLEAILFDCDGVLADTERDGHRLAFNIAFKDSGIDEEWSEERYGKLLEVGGGKERMTAHWNEVGWPDEIPEAGRSDKIMGLHLQKTDVFMQLIDEGKIPLRPGVLRIIDEAISNGVRLAVCSTSNEKAVSNLVSTLMGKDRAAKFQIYAGDMVKNKKPAPDVYLMAVDKMGLDKDRCVIVEDSHIGVGAAVAAGIACLVTKSSYTAWEDFTGAKMIVDELGDGADTRVTLETLSSLLGDDTDDEVRETSWESAGPGPRGIGVKMEAHIESGGASWTGARFGEENVIKPHYTASETYEASGPRGIGVKMEAHIESGGASWTGARFGEENVIKPHYTASETYEASGPRGIGVKMEAHIESGGASWTGARFGDDNVNTAHTYTPSETSYEFKSKGKSGWANWDSEAHTEVPAEGSDKKAWSGARFGDENIRRSAPTPSQWHE